MRRRLTFTVACALLTLAVAGCSGDDSNDAAPTGTSPAVTEPAPPPAAGGKVDPAPGKTLLGFVKAAGRGDADAMWNLLSEPTQASIGPTLADFRAGAAQDFELGLGSLAPTAEVTLSRRLDANSSVAAVTGERESDGETERYSYGAALTRENGKLRIELGGVAIGGYEPAPLEEVTDTRPEVGAKAVAGGNDLVDLRLWLDGKPLPFRRGPNDTPFTATLRGRPDEPLAAGEHEVVVFAATESDGTASAWPFTVK